ncbi:hypothetical protein U9M48_002254 [Paspalum notatum var. saurae]|uniref:Receptor kinase-like protein Xa21 n=1 Tax=Paspalum notatum var. saurae TaxID=547442 RepID=A0AAQ3PHH1_PASNO
MAEAVTLLCFSFLFFCSLPLVSAGSSNATADELALLAFKSILSSSSNGLLASWNTSSHYCSWPGVVCSHRQPERVVSLLMGSFQLSGRMSPFLGNLSFLKKLDLHGNQFVGQIPPELGQLNRLQMLNLSTNTLHGSIPVAMGGCTNLSMLDLSSNLLRGEIPTEVGTLKNLVDLRLHNNSLSGKIPLSLVDSPSIEYLSLRKNRLSGEIPLALGNLTSLRHLDLADNMLSGTIPSSLGRLSRLSVFNLGYNNLTGLIPTSLWNISSLTVFAVQQNMLSGTIPPNAFSNLPHLQMIAMDDNKFHGYIPSSLGNASDLSFVQLSYNLLSGIVPPEVERLRELNWLQISNNLLQAKEPKDWEFVSALTNCSQLQTLDFGANKFKGLVPDSFSNLSVSLTFLSISVNEISGSIPKDIGNLISLQYLDLSNNYFTGTLPFSLSKLKNLQSFSVYSNQFSGSIPMTIGNLTELNYLDFDTNTFSGRIPSTLGNMTNLLALGLSNNNFTGRIPIEIFNIPTLSGILELSNNNLEGPIPQEIGNLKNLVEFYAYSNKLTGEIPSTIGECLLLQNLYLQNNMLTGTIPSGLSQLKGLENLDLSSNNLSGQIPMFLGNISMLYYLNLSFNSFVGEVPTFGVFANASGVSIEGNVKLCGGIPDLHLSPCSLKLPKKKHELLVVPIVVSLVATLAILSMLYMLLIWRKRSKTKTSSTTTIQGHPLISYAQLVRSTDGFSTANLLGSGSFGSVYKGELDDQAAGSTNLVAVKVLKLHTPGAFKSFIAECEALRNMRHRNLVKIVTACASIDARGNDFKAIVYEFMPNGSLESWLHPNSNEQTEERHLDLVQRLSILLDVAYALQYLHWDGPAPVVHCDIKSSNVLLDADMVAHLGDFGLAKIIVEGSSAVEQSMSSMGFRGTIGYAAPEYGAGNVASTNGDIYSYGILVLEMITGKRPTDSMFTEGMSLREYVALGLHGRTDVIDMRLSLSLNDELQSAGDSSSESKIDCLISLLRIGLSCSEEEPSSRMSNEGSSNATGDELALLSFKSMLSSPSEGLLGSWNTSSHFCSWAGVSCSHRHHERVVSLLMNSFSLQGRISPSLGNLSFLREMDLGGNSLVGEIPPELGRLSRLVSLNLSQNSLQGGIPAAIAAGCTNLTSLDLSNNDLQGNIPLQFGAGMKSLVRLSLWKNNLSGEIPLSLAELPSLQYLYLDSNKLSGEIPSALGNLTGIRQLYVQKNRLSGQIPSSLGQLPSLWDLDVESNNLTGVIPSSIWNTTSLMVFSVQYNMLSGTIPPNAFSALPHLRAILMNNNLFHGYFPVSLTNASNMSIIQLDGNFFSGIISPEIGRLRKLKFVLLDSNLFEAKEPNDWGFITELTNCSQLQELGLSANKLGGVLPDSISNLSTSLHILDVGNNKISGSIPKDISHLINLRLLSFSYNLFMGNLPSSLGRLQNLAGLYVSQNNLRGPVPSSLGNLTGLNELWLDKNVFSGRIPETLGNLTELLSLGLSTNNFSGSIPSILFNIQTLTKIFDISHNYLEGPIPREVGNFKNLMELHAESNKLSGEIPSTLGECQILQHLYLQNNFLNGSIPSALSQLKGLQTLDLSSNNLSGQIPKFLGNITMLYLLNLSFNNFVGEVPTVGVFANASKISIKGNEKLCGGIPDLHLPPCSLQLPKKKHKFLVVSILIPLIATPIVVALLYKLLSWYTKTKEHIPSTVSMQGHPLISYSQLVRATDGFSTSNLLGSGSFGSVYKAELDESSGNRINIVAVKVLKLQTPGALKSFTAECETLRNLRHRNLVKIITACSSIDNLGNDFKAIVFDFMPNGNLEGWLHPDTNNQADQKYLNILDRVTILLDVANALDYLHYHGPAPVVHCDLKPSNVLLDAAMVAHVGDFGIAKIIVDTSSQQSMSTMGFRGTVGYAPPEYGVGNMVSTHGDIYSYGILVLEMVTGKRPMDSNFTQGLSLREYVELGLQGRVLDVVDTQLSLGQKNEFQNAESFLHGTMIDSLISLLRLGVSCSHEMPSNRMSTGDIIKELRCIKESLIVPPGETRAAVGMNAAAVRPTRQIRLAVRRGASARVMEPYAA